VSRYVELADSEPRG